MTTPAEPATVRRVLQRVVLPTSRDTDVLPLYVDPDRPELDVNTLNLPLKARAKIPPIEANAEIAPDPHAVLDRRRYQVNQSTRISFGTYFNAFAASYWRRWTVVDEVSLQLRITGKGARVIVYRSMPDGRAQRVDDAIVESIDSQDFRFDRRRGSGGFDSRRSGIRIAGAGAGSPSPSRTRATVPSCCSASESTW